MDQLTNHKLKIDFLLSDNTSLDLPQQTTIKPNRKRKMTILCSECNQKRKRLDENHQICQVCYKAKSVYIPSGNKVIDDFIKHTLISGNKLAGKIVFVPYDQFENVEFIAEGGFSKIYKAIWVDGPTTITWNEKKYENYEVVLKKLNNSKGITSKELNELKIFHEFSLNRKIKGSYGNNVSRYFGITQDLVTNDIMIIMPHYELGDLGLSKSATEITDDDNNKENYGIIPYMAPEIFKGKKYTKESDIYSFGMIMWEFMTSRRPFWNRSHDAELIIEICDGLRPPIVTNAPEGYIELMKECWHSDPNKRPIAADIYHRIEKMYWNEQDTRTKIIQSSDIGPVTTNNPGAIYRSRPLSGMIQSAMFTMSTSLRSQSITAEFELSNYHQKNDISFNDKRKFDDTQIENSFNDGDKFIKKVKLIENENNDYTTQEFELDINIDSEQFIDDEILRGRSYTSASDIFSFSMIMWELTSGVPPFNNRAHDIQLSLSICKGERPEIIENTPQCYVDLMKKCWNEDPLKRPSTVHQK
ncbi:kinase-like domain-containing protein [Rhizophagus irregularis DAOM 181602=DAOM 197198]|uniref:Kinase-like domain-containing protein n=1 Tax=Rhizophagus irregularis (strain DAOM 181602 / DAOM 197198 / MUCL 43194) TaxID=747089 RepID=A0A2P4QZA6_RHIID|nr:kinase-like domain-containing protein [Rhizophagus irregularis DAOM 181602=DAOM 197198]POG82979.1 kinase-like domain-containing protein [Rhizophagus irregularis DAOM 181602=DAOM 197198]|eukprot:XP_025189845.1 kinase-like domain-containing protein [Rhizophagus irregularis DAOM 181602=DAOM 197198]